MTDEFDIQKCSVIRKIAIGEILEEIKDAPEGEREEVEDIVVGVFRKRLKALKDGAIGWVTVRSKATSYLETVPNSYYVLTSKAPLVKPRRPGAKDAGAIVRQLEQGEIFIADGPPQKASPKPPNLTSNVRTLNDDV